MFFRLSDPQLSPSFLLLGVGGEGLGNNIRFLDISNKIIEVFVRLLLILGEGEN